MTESVRTANELINDKSPYLLQHAYNPVNWFPWGEKAFAKAKAEDKPVFLSIGYSTCHWCHVMAHESFEDEEVADILNKHYICVKVDREERPDIDQIYMNACQAIAGQGGWPLTIVMTPEKKPFFAGTYFPKKGKWGRPGLIEILSSLASDWEKDREDLINVSHKVADVLGGQKIDHSGELGEHTIKAGFDGFRKAFDHGYGGFGTAPKFPAPHNLLFLLRYWKWTHDDTAMEIVEKTLDAMASGGIFDHIGFGFHRYSTDRRWLVPHFEKMLYDNALLAYTYLEAYQATGKERYAEVANKVFRYVRRDMTFPEGGFYSAEDADSEGVEGKFYVFTPSQIKSVLGDDDGDLFCSVYDITAEGNFEGNSIPNLLKSSDVPEIDMIRLNRFKDKLYEAREKRPKPHKDDKILTSWNGLMIAALAKGARVLKDDSLADLAERATEFIFTNLWGPGERLMARYRDGEAAFLGYLDDYAFMIWGLTELYEATFKPQYLKRAIELNDGMMELFWDFDGGGLFFNSSDSEELIVRPKEIYDGATPSGNSVAAFNLIRLSRFTGDENPEDKAHQILSAFAGEVDSYPMGHSFSLLALLAAVMPSKEIVITGDAQAKDTLAMVLEVSSHYLPEAVTILNTAGKHGEEMRSMINYLKDMKPREDKKATAYVCENFTCNAPTTDIGKMKELLHNK